MECRFYPDIVAEVRYAQFARTWAMRDNGVKTASLELPSPTASDEEIIFALSTFRMVCKATIHRE